MDAHMLRILFSIVINITAAEHDCPWKAAKIQHFIIKQWLLITKNTTNWTIGYLTRNVRNSMVRRLIQNGYYALERPKQNVSKLSLHSSLPYQL